MAADPRNYFSSERTLAAWLRTGLTLVALGFVVARFGMLAALMYAEEPPSQASPPPFWSATTLGIALVLVGVLLVIGAAVNHRRFVRSLPPQDVPALALAWLPGFGALAVAAIGLLLAAYLWASV